MGNSRAALLLLALASAGAGCGSTSNGLGVPHEDPEPIGSAPWEGSDHGSSDGDPGPQLGRGERAKKRARNGQDPNRATPSASASASAVPPTPNPVDTDHDGVEDARDVCPREPGADDANPAWAGCPYDAPPRPTPALFQELDLVFGDTPRALDPKETELVGGLAADLKSEPSITVLVYARKAQQGEGWLKIVTKPLVDVGIDRARIHTQVCLRKTGLTHTVVSRGKKECEAP